MSSSEPNKGQPNPLSGPYSRFLQEAELQRLLTDEKLRSEQHKLNFQTLKAEFQRYQEDYKKLQNQLKQTVEENNLAKESYETMIQQYKTELVQKKLKIEELRKDITTPHQIQLIRMNLLEEVEKPYQERLASAEEETEQYREACNKLRYNYSFLKAEFEHAQQEFERIQEEMKLKFEAELSRITQDRNNLNSLLNAAKKTQESSTTKEVQNENMELKHRIKLLQNEIEEFRAQRDHSSSHTDSLQRLQNKQLAEHTATLRSMEMEKSSLQMQLDRLQREMKDALNVQNELTAELKESQQKSKELHTKLQDTEYKNRINAANLRMELMKEKGEVERERDHLLGDIENIKAELEVAQQSLQNQMKLAKEMEKESKKQLQTVQEEEWKQRQILETEKMELESKVEELEHLNDESESKFKALLAKERDEGLSHLKEKQALQTELEILKSKQNITYMMYGDQQQKELLAENKKLLDAKNELENMVKEVREQKQECQKLLDEMRNSFTRSQNEVEKEKILRDTKLIQQQLDWEENKMQFQKRIASLEQQLMETRSKCSSENHVLKLKIKKYRQILVKIKNRNHILKAKTEELEAEKELLKKNVPHHEHRLVQKQVRDLQRRINEVNHLKLAVDPSFVSLRMVETDMSQSEPQQNIYQGGSLTNITEKEIAAVKNRIQILSKKQRRQLIQLNKEVEGNADDEESSEESLNKSN